MIGFLRIFLSGLFPTQNPGIGRWRRRAGGILFCCQNYRRGPTRIYTSCWPRGNAMSLSFSNTTHKAVPPPPVPLSSFFFSLSLSHFVSIASHYLPILPLLFPLSIQLPPTLLVSPSLLLSSFNPLLHKTKGKKGKERKKITTLARQKPIYSNA